MKNRMLARIILALSLGACATSLMVRAADPQAVGTFVAGGAVAETRAGAASAVLGDGTTMVIGGRDADGNPTDGIVVYDAAMNGVTVIGHLSAPRVGHTASLLADGRVAVIGGSVSDAPTGTIEIVDPATGATTFGGTLPQPRTRHAAATLQDGRIVIAGGNTPNATGNGLDVLATAELYDPATGSTSPVPGSMSTGRAGASATLLVDGRVLIAGGYDANGTDLASAEIFQADSAGAFELVETKLSVARSGHTAVLLPHNNSVLIAGGTKANMPVDAADLFLPAEFPDPYSYSIGTMAPTGSLTAPRARGFGGPKGDDGLAYVAGGGVAGSEVYSFATIKTDKDDYAPGENAVITGSGWQPGEVTLVFQEDPAVHDDYVLTVTAGPDGTFDYRDWAPELHDLNVRFYLTAKQGQRKAQITFTDAARTVTVKTESGFAANITATRYTNSNVCVGTTATTDPTPGQVFAATSTGVTVTVGNVNNQSTKLTAAATATTPAGEPFRNWAPGTFASVAGDPYSICVSGTNGNTTETFTALYGVPSVQFAAATSSDQESQANSNPRSLDVTLSAPSISTVTVNYAVTGGTATGSGVDYTLLGTGTLSFSPGDTSKPIHLNLVNDTIDESDETVIVTLSSLSNATLGAPSSHTYTINDNDAAPVLTIADVSQAEGNSGTSLMTFTVTKVGATELTAGVNFATTSVGGTATTGSCVVSGIDYVATSGSLSFAPGDATKTFTVTICGDTTSEANETFFVNLSGATNAALTGAGADPQAVGTITNDDANNTPPVANTQTAGTNEDTDVVIALTGSDTNVGDTLAFKITALPAAGSLYQVGPDNVTPGLQIVAVPTNVINEAHNVLFRPAANGNGTPYTTFGFKINDGTEDSTQATVTVNVAAVNDPPSLENVPATKTINELVPYTFTATATDDDLPAQTLTFSLVGAPEGASIGATSGVFTWTPSEAQGSESANYTFTVRVSDGVPSSYADQQITIHVNEVNVVPSLEDVPTSVTINELVPYAFTATATDDDLPAQTLTFSLVGAPEGASIGATSGVFTWTPSEAQGSESANYTFTVRVSDGVPASYADRQITIHVSEVNVAPVLRSIGSKSVNELEALAFTASASDSDLPANTLTYSLAACAAGTSPAGASIAGGVFSWTPSEADGPGTFCVKVVVTDNGTPAFNDSEEVTISVAEVNVAPVLGAIGNKSIVLGETVAFTASATDADIPANALTFSLDGPPAGASITASTPDTAGFSWTPTAAQVGTTAVTVKVSDNGLPVLSDSETFNVTVTYRVCALYDQTKSHKKGSTVPVKLYLCDTAGNNVSTPGTVVRALNVSKLDNTASGLPDDSGNANQPDLDFRYDQALKLPNGGYIFNLSTKSLSTGTWKLSFSVGGASEGAYYVTFDVK